jgi:hypothetical protein
MKNAPATAIAVSLPEIERSAAMLSGFFTIIHLVRADVPVMTSNERRCCLSGCATIAATW